MFPNDGQAVFCTVVEGDAERGIVVAGWIEDPVRLVAVFPQGTRPKLRAPVVAATCQFGRHPQSGEARTVNRHEPQIAAHFHRREGAPGEIFESQNSYGRIAEKRLGKAHFEGGPQIAYAESPGRIVETMNRLAAGARAEPKRIPGRRVNSHPAAPGSHTAQREALRQGWFRRHADLTPPVLQTTRRWRPPFRPHRISALRGSSCPPRPERVRATPRVGSRGCESGTPEGPPQGRQSPRPK